MNRPATPASICAEIAALGRRRRAAEAALAVVVNERAALGRSESGRAEQSRIAGLNLQHTELATEIDVLRAHADVAREMLGELLEERVREAPVRRPDPVAIVRALLAESRRADQAMADLAAALIGRAALARRLAGLGRPAAQISNPARVLAAAGHHGLDQFAAGCPARLFAPLAAADEAALGSLAAAKAASAREVAA